MDLVWAHAKGNIGRQYDSTITSTSSSGSTTTIEAVERRLIQEAEALTTNHMLVESVMQHVDTLFDFYVKIDGDNVVETPLNKLSYNLYSSLDDSDGSFDSDSETG